MGDGMILHRQAIIIPPDQLEALLVAEEYQARDKMCLAAVVAALVAAMLLIWWFS
jgi:hypothetical protein